MARPEPLGHAVDEHRLELGREADAGGVAPCAGERLGGDPVQPHVLGIAAGLVAAGQLDQVVDERAQLLGLLDHVGEQAAAVLGVELAALEQHLDVRAQARHRRAQLVRGVGDELALGAHRFVERVARALQAVEHRVEAGRQLADLVVGVDAQAAGEVLGLADVLGGLRDLAERAQDAPGGQPAEDRRQRDAAERTAATRTSRR